MAIREHANADCGVESIIRERQRPAELCLLQLAVGAGPLGLSQHFGADVDAGDLGETVPAQLASDETRPGADVEDAGSSVDELRELGRAPLRKHVVEGVGEVGVVILGPGVVSGFHLTGRVGRVHPAHPLLGIGRGRYVRLLAGQALHLRASGCSNTSRVSRSWHFVP